MAKNMKIINYFRIFLVCILATSISACVTSKPNIAQRNLPNKIKLSNQVIKKIPRTPILKLETGMHTAMINRIGIDKDGRLLATPSDDKTVRIWDIQNNKLLRVLRLPIGSGAEEGMPQSAAISPDGKTIACSAIKGSWENSSSIYLFDVQSGILKKRITGLPAFAFRLTYSKDGRYLAAILSKKGIQIFETPDYSLVFKDTDYGSRSQGGDFDQQGRLVTASFDKYIRLYDTDFKLIAKRKMKSGQIPYLVDFSPEGSKIAVGSFDSVIVEVLSGNDLDFLYSPVIKNLGKHSATANLMSVCWSADGQFLYAGGRFSKKYDNKEYAFPIIKWSDEGQGEFKELIASKNTISSILPLPNGGIVYGACDPCWGIFDSGDRRKFFHSPSTFDVRANRSRFLLSSNGKTIGFYYSYQDKNPTVFSIYERKLAEYKNDSALKPPILTKWGIKVTDWKNKRIPKLNSRPLTSWPDDGESSCVTISPNGECVLLGTATYLLSFDQKGNEKWRISGHGGVWAVNITSDSKFAVAMFGDGTIRWYNLSDGKELLALFTHADKKKWILWTPEGFFDHSPGAEKLIGFHINQGIAREAKFISIAQLYDLYYRPDLVRKKLEVGYESEIASEFAKIGDIQKILSEGMPPTLRILSPESTKTVKEQDINLKIQLTDNGGGIGKIVYRLNGITIGTDDTNRGIVRNQKKGGKSVIVKKLITLQPGDNQIMVTAFNEKNVIESAPVSIELFLKGVTAEKPSLYILTIGINDYRDHALKLTYSVPDARSFADEIKIGGKGLFQKTEVKYIFDQDATIEKIERAFAYLSKKVKTNDMFVFYAAGHGMNLDGKYHFIPWELIYENEDSVREHSLTQEKIQKLLAMIPAMKSMILLDTCNSGAFAKPASRGLAEKTAIDKLMRATGRATIVASSATQVAIEGYKGHGVFTYVLLQGLKGDADKKGNKNGEISINELAEYIGEEVPKITLRNWGFEQFPMQNLYGRSFPIGLVK